DSILAGHRRADHHAGQHHLAAGSRYPVNPVYSATPMNKTLSYRLRVLWTAFRLRCPNCGQGRTFTGLFAMNKTCPYCGVRFERESGESVGGMYFNLVAAELLTMGGFFTVNALFAPPF